MFRKTDTTPQLDLFTAPSNILPKRAQKKYTDEKAWHNQFFKLVTSQIDEESFRPLFEETKMGAPNASIRILVAMSILKEGFGCREGVNTFLIESRGPTISKSRIRKQEK